MKIGKTERNDERNRISRLKSHHMIYLLKVVLYSIIGKAYLFLICMTKPQRIAVK